MNYLKNFNEKFGILKSLEEQANNYFIIINNSNSLRFQFIYKLNDIECSFTLIINTKIIEEGEFVFNIKTKERTIYLKSKEDKSVLLHELKHLDYSLRKENWYNSLFKKTQNILPISKKKSFLTMNEIFYMIDQNEFEARYYGYYVEVDNYIKNNISENPSKDEIKYLYYDYLKLSKDRVHTFYLYTKEFKFEDFIDTKDLNFIFFFLLDKDLNLNLLKYAINNIYKLYKKIFNKYTNDDLSKINKLKLKYEKEINKKLRKYNHKFNKLLYLMLDKYL